MNRKIPKTMVSCKECSIFWKHLLLQTVFLSMKLTKTKFRAKLMDTNLKNQLRVAQSTLNTDIKGLASVK